MKAIYETERNARKWKTYVAKENKPTKEQTNTTTTSTTVKLNIKVVRQTNKQNVYLKKETERKNCSFVAEIKIKIIDRLGLVSSSEISYENIA